MTWRADVAMLKPDTDDPDEKKIFTIYKYIFIQICRHVFLCSALFGENWWWLVLLFTFFHPREYRVQLCLRGLVNGFFLGFLLAKPGLQ